MSDAANPPPARRTDRDARDERLARALRANLQRRKEQRRSREQRPAAARQRGEPGDDEPLA